MRIGLDVNPLVTGHQFRGIGTYVKNLLQALLGSTEDHSYFLYRSVGDLTVPTPKQPVLHLINKQKESLFQQAQKDGIKVLHVTDYYHPIYTLSELQQIKQHGIKVIISIPDAIPLRFPALYPSEKYFLEKNLTPLLSIADRVIAISRATANDLIKFFSLPPSLVSVTHLGVDLKLFCSPVKEGDTQVLQKYGIQYPYFIYVGGFDWRKNCETILRAFLVFLRDAPASHQLVFVGNDPPTPVMLEVMEIMPEKPVKTGFVPVEDLPPLYRQATALLFPSRFEGFGLPVLEAMACGTPVITSNKASLPEIVGDGGILIDPDNPADWVEAMKSLSSNPSLSETLRAKGLSRVPSFTWEECALQTLQVYSS